MYQEWFENAEITRMEHPAYRIFHFGAVILSAVLVAVTITISLLLGSLPNGMQFLDTLDFGLLQILWEDNAWATLKLVLIDKPLVVIEHLDHQNGRQVWGIFYFSGSVLIYLLISAFTAWHWKQLKHSTTGQRILFTLGALAVLLSATYFRLATCCSNDPIWILETWLLSNATNPVPGLINWLSIYEKIHPYLNLVQAGVLLGGIAIVSLSARIKCTSGR